MSEPDIEAVIEEMRTEAFGIEGGYDAGAGTSSGGLGGVAQQPIVVNFDGDIIGTDAKSLSKYLVADIATELRNLQSRTTGPLLGK